MGPEIQCVPQHGGSVDRARGQPILLRASAPAGFRPRPGDPPAPCAASPEVRADPFSVPNMLAALLGRDLKARITRSGDPPHAAAHIQVDMPVKGRARFVLIGKPSQGTTGWRAVWDGNDSKPGLRHRRLSEATEAYRRMLAAMREGRRSVQPDLFG